VAKKSPLIDTAEAARELGVSPRRVQHLIANERLPAQLIGGVYVINRTDLSLVRHRKPGRPWPKKAGQTQKRR
jgi:excisionase family DNA binding protein